MAVVRTTAELVLDVGAARGEGPLWDERAQRLLWVDVDAHAVHRFDPASGLDERQDVGQPVGAVALRERGGLALALRDGFGLLEDGGVTIVARPEAAVRGNRMNDGKVDPGGRFWAGTMALDMRRGAGALYRLDPDLEVRTMLDGVSVSNGLDWSPDGAAMYFVDSLAGGVDAFAFDAEPGSISGRRRLVEIPPDEGLPDGMTVDADGCLWVALWGGGCVRRYSPSGSLLGIVELPVSQVTSCAFGGADLGELYITSARADLPPERAAAEPLAGGLFVCRPGARGRLPNAFLS